MEIFRLGNIRIRKEKEGDTLIISPQNLTECIKYINEHAITKLEINDDFEFLDVNF